MATCESKGEQDGGLGWLSGGGLKFIWWFIFGAMNASLL